MTLAKIIEITHTVIMSLIITYFLTSNSSEMLGITAVTTYFSIRFTREVFQQQSNNHTGRAASQRQPCKDFLYAVSTRFLVTLVIIGSITRPKTTYGIILAILLLQIYQRWTEKPGNVGARDPSRFPTVVPDDNALEYHHDFHNLIEAEGEE
ncbi:hypothetical protein LTR05_007037 [Lithohypha guttulata]|uniref:Uncharacterized protein n=1 Tax=Lithohypha guttulata TaxID=1690604 RepID=A0AAN7Y9I5_9EURO|nr:hypothetical protein LTR05_007037 [Lithohypha guttulata]